MEGIDVGAISFGDRGEMITETSIEIGAVSSDLLHIP